MASHRTVRVPLFRERYVGVVASSHPRVTGDAVTLEQLAAEHHATVFGPSGHAVPRSCLLYTSRCV